MEWFEELGFEENPFGDSPGFSARFAVGLEKPLSELEYYVSSGSIVFVEGAAGSGKTVLLRMLSGRLGGKAVCVDCSAGELDVRLVIRKKTSFIGRLLGKSPKNIALLIDNAANFSAKAMGLIKYYYDNNNFGSVVFAGSSLKSAKLSPAIADRIGSRLVKLPVLGEEDAVLLVKRRLGSSNVLNDSTVRKLYKMSGKNAKKFLQLCASTCEAAVASEKGNVVKLRGDLSG